MAEEPRNLRDCFNDAEKRRLDIESAGDTNSDRYQHELARTLALYETCQALADDISLFSVNESVEDITSANLRYLSINFYLAGLILRVTVTNRKLNLLHARSKYESFLKQLDQYDILSKEDAELYEKYKEDPGSFSTASVSDAGLRRQQKIEKFRQEKALKARINVLEQDPGLASQDDSIVRELFLSNIKLSIHQSLQSLESIQQELQLISIAPPSPPPEPTPSTEDARSSERVREDAYSERLDQPVSQLLNGGREGPILNNQGRPLRPFTLLDTRQRLQQGVFRPDHNLPTMTIDEYLEQEKRRGGIIENGANGTSSNTVPNEDDYAHADEETMKARQWDEFVENNPKGSGNTINRG